MIIKLTLDRFEDDNAVLVTDDNKTAIWPSSLLPKETKEGSVIYFALTNDLKASADSKQLAKNILNEILNP